MKLHRFFLEDALGAATKVVVRLPGFLNQVKNVLRFKVGDTIVIFDNSGFDYIAIIEDFSNEGVSLSITEKRENKVHPSRETYLFASVVKKDTFEWIVEKATELGVSHIIPVISSRTEKKDVNSERLLKIATEAAEQSGRGTVPTIHEVANLSDTLANYSYLRAVVWEPTAEKFQAKELDEINSMYIGPEGGWTQEELQMFKDHGIMTRSLGPQILRAETAVVAALSQIVF